MDFLEHLMKAAPDGETILIVKQKPTSQKHKDGSIKYFWPAYLPDKYRGEGAWYANTASFVLDRFTDGKVHAGAAYCDYVAFMVLDDIGTKSKTPPLEPTWKMETSPGNFQWGYKFKLDEQPTKGEFSAAIVAIAEAGYTDPGAINPVRNFRLPGSINLKDGRDNFASDLAEHTPERMFTLKEICDALGVTPHDPDTSTRRKLTLDDNGQDDVLKWMYDRGEVIENGNAEGWFGVVCPNAAEHSDGNAMGRYHPLNRAYTCFHGHCGDWTSRRFLCWVAEEGGPKHEHGLREELIAKAMNEALSKLSPTAAFPDAAAEVIAEIERKELGRVEKADWYKRFAYIQEDEAFFDLQDRREISRSTFNALFRHITCKSIHNGRRIEASVCFDENRQAMEAKVLVGITYAAGESVLVARDGDVYGNRWRDARPQSVPGDAQPWLDHVALLIPDERERQHLLDMMAFKVQNPTIKINHAVLHGGDEGCGKDTMWAPFIWAICGPGLKNRGLVDNDSISSAWGYHLESEVLIINELKEADAKERRALANKLKPLIAAPPEMLPINRKGLHPYMMLNRMFVLAFSNDPVPISLPSQDRRWFCVWSHAPRMNEDDATRLWKYFQDGGFAAVAHMLQTRDVSAFNPAATPFMTDFKINLVESGMSLLESYLMRMIVNREGSFTNGVIGGPFHALCDTLSVNAPNGMKIPQSALLHALKEGKWVDKGRLASAKHGTKKHIFCAPEYTDWSKSDLRDFIEPKPQPKFNIV